MGVPKMSRATSPAMSTSKPVISPVIGSRNENRLLPMSRPTISRPRSRILATAASASALLGNGRRLAVRSQLSSSGLGGCGGSGGSLGHPGRGGRRQRRHRRRHVYSVWPQPASTVAVTTAMQARAPPAAGRHHRYSLSLGHRPSATAIAAPTDSTAPPTVVPDSTRRADRMSLRNWLRLSRMPLDSASSSLSNAGGGVVLAGAQRHLGGGLVVADRDVGVDPLVGLPPLDQQLVGARPGRSCRWRRCGPGIRPSCWCIWFRRAGSRTVCGRLRRRGGSATASRRRGPAAR